MKANIGDEIVIDSEHAGTPPRAGQILEVIEADYGTRYRVRWEDGHESVIHPIAGTVHVLRSAASAAEKKPERVR